MSELEKRFEAWWRAEAVKSCNAELLGAIKKLCHTAWMNAAYVQADLLMDAKAKEQG